jgi:YesN/AraC family two-component response regulator
MARILLIDDEELVRATLRILLEETGYEVIEAANGRKGVARQNETPCDLVITDIVMPDMEGIETIIQLKRNNPDVKIIAISGGGRTGNSEYLVQAQKLGADRALGKPFSNAELIANVEELLAEASGSLVG